MKLEVHERLSLLEILNVEEEHYAALRTLRRAREMLSFDGDELKLLEFKQVQAPDGSVQFGWNQEAAESLVKDVPVDEWTTHYIRAKLISDEEQGKLKSRHLSLFEKFVSDYG